MTAALLLGLLAGAAWASNPDRTGTAGGQELKIPNSARGMALGGGLVSDPGGVEMLYYNPAAIAGVTRVEAYFSNLAYFANMSKNYFAVAAKTDMGTFAASADILSIGDIEETTEENPEGTGRIFSPNFSMLGLSYGRYMTDLVTIGATAKLVNESILQTSATGLVFDAGIQYRPGPKGLLLGLAIKNFGPSMTFNGSDFESFHSTSDNPQANDRSLRSQSASFELPSYFEMGARYNRALDERIGVTGFGTFRSDNFYHDAFKIGAEFNYQEIFFLRAGGSLNDDKNTIYGPTYGAGFAIPISGGSAIVVDYGVQMMRSYFGDTHMVSIKFNF
jgi:hypothetical protein